MKCNRWSIRPTVSAVDAGGRFRRAVWLGSARFGAAQKPPAALHLTPWSRQLRTRAASASGSQALTKSACMENDVPDDSVMPLVSPLNGYAMTNDTEGIGIGWLAGQMPPAIPL